MNEKAPDEKGTLDIGALVASKVNEEADKQAELKEARRLLAKREEERRRRGEPVGCTVCSNGRVTLYNTTVRTAEGIAVVKRCGAHR